MRKAEAVFLDRDGLINDLVYYPEQAMADSPFTVRQFRLSRGVAKQLRRLGGLGFKLAVVSNQPGVAKRHMSLETLNSINRKMEKLLAKEGVKLDGEYLCLHHPEATDSQYRRNCSCRKPKPGLLLKGSKELGVSLDKSWMVGDGLTDVLAGKRAGCRTILLGSVNSLLVRKMAEMGAQPDYPARTFAEAANIIESASSRYDF